MKHLGQKTISLLLILLLIMPMAAIVPASAYYDDPVFGDVDQDGTITTFDSSMIEAYCNQTIELSGAQLVLADVNGDDKVDADDVAVIEDYLRGVLTQLPIYDVMTEYGSCGSDVMYQIKSGNTVVIFGSGKMDNFYSNKPSPFRENDSITTVRVTGGVTSVGSSAFWDCHSVRSVQLADTVTEIGASAFHGCSDLEEIELPDNITTIGNDAFYACISLIELTLPSQPRAIEGYTFNGCTSLRRINVPDKVKSIGDWAFSQCRSLTGLTLPNGITWVGEYAFNGCEKLKSINIPDNVTDIPTWCFGNCKSLASVTIPEGVTEIGPSAFYNCDSLAAVYFPSTIETIAEKAFDSCESLTDIYYPGTADEWNSVTVGGSNEPLSAAAAHTSDSGSDTVKPVVTLTATNHVAETQSVTIGLSDNEAVAGYYWGKSEIYSANPYKAATAGAVTETVEESGIYYATAVDTSGNVSVTHSITFYKTMLNASGGSVSLAFVLTKANNSFIFPEPVRDGFTYVGWSMSSSASAGVKSLTPSGDSTYYAVWTGGDTTTPTASLSSTNNVASSQTVTLSMSDNVDIQGYYWGTSSSYESNVFTTTSSASVTKTISAAGTYYFTAVDTSGNASVTQSITFYKTILNANGGSVSPSSVLTRSGNSFTFPTPTRSGYTYNGWATSSYASSGVKTLTPSSNATYYALWSYNDSQKPTASLSSTNNVASSQTVTLSMSDNVGIQGYYWGTSSSYESNVFTTTSSASVTKTISAAGTYYFTAVDTSGNASVTQSITFYKTILNANGGSVSPSSVLTRSGNSFTFPTPTRSNYTYNGWATSSSASSGVKTLTPSSNATYYALWSYNDSQKPTASLSSTNNVAPSQTVTITLNDNFDLAGCYWGTNSTYSANSFTSVIGTSKEVTKTVSAAGTYYVTAKDKAGNLSTTRSITFYQTTLNANGGSVSPSLVLTPSGESFTLPTPTRSNYNYNGWATSASATSGIKTLSPSSNATYYAVWSYNDSQKPTASLSSTNHVASSQTVTLSMSDNVGIDGYYWGTSSRYTANTFTLTSSTSVTKTVSAAGTYYFTSIDTSGNASETKSITFYKTTLDANGGSVSPTSVLTQSGKSITLPTPTRSSYTYNGWATSASANSGVKTLTPSANATYYAVWKTNDTTKPTVTISSTNNVSSSQTVTITLSDNYEVAGYYWGTSSTYSANSFASVSGTSKEVTKSVSTAGTYYVTAKDKAGNLSTTRSITFYKTTLNANGGSVSPSSVLTQSGKSITLPTPTRSGYTYNGWSTSSAAASGIKTLSPSSNATYYAVWKNNSPANNITLDKLTYSFGNNNNYFGYPYDYEIPLSVFQMIYGNTSLANTYYNWYSDWGGNCFGMSTTTAFFNVSSSGVKVTDYRSSASKPKDLKVGDSNGRITLTRFIEAMQISQFHSDCRTEYNRTSDDLEGLLEAVSNVKYSGKPIPIGVYGVAGGYNAGHEVVGYSVEKYSSSITYINIYDCNFPNTARRITVYTNSSGKPTGWYYKLNDRYNWGTGYANCGIDYNTYDVMINIWKNRAKGTNGYNTLISTSDNFEVYNVNGDRVATVSEGLLTDAVGDIQQIIPKGVTMDDTVCTTDVILYLPVDYYLVTNTDDDEQMTVSMTDCDRTACVTTSADDIVFMVDDMIGANEAIIYSDAAEPYEITFTITENTTLETFSVSGVTDEKAVSVSCADGAVSMSSSNNVHITVNDIAVNSGDAEGIDLSDAEIVVAPNPIEYDGTSLQPSVTVTLGGAELMKNRDFAVVYSDNDLVGTAKVRIYGMNGYKGTAEAEFEIIRSADTIAPLLGDVDGDGKVDVYDASSIQKSLAGTAGYVSYDTLDQSDIAFRVADVDGDGKVDIYDASLIQRFIAGDAAARNYRISESLE